MPWTSSLPTHLGPHRLHQTPEKLPPCRWNWGRHPYISPRHPRSLWVYDNGLSLLAAFPPVSSPYAAEGGGAACPTPLSPGTSGTPPPPQATRSQNRTKERTLCGKALLFPREGLPRETQVWRKISSFALGTPPHFYDQALAVGGISHTGSWTPPIDWNSALFTPPPPSRPSLLPLSIPSASLEPLPCFHLAPSASPSSQTQPSAPPIDSRTNPFKERPFRSPLGRPGLVGLCV